MATSFDEFKRLRKQGLSFDAIRGGETNRKTDLGGVFGGAARFLGVEEFGTGIGRAISGTKQVEQASQGLSEQQTRVLERIKRNRELGKDSSRLQKSLQKSFGGFDISRAIEDVGTAGLTNQQVLGSAAQTGLGILSAGAPVAKTIRGTAGIGAGLGAGFGGSESFKRGEGFVRGAATGAIIGGVSGGLLKVAQKAIQTSTTKAPERLIKSTLRQSTKDLQAEATGRKPVLSKQFLERGLKGSEESIVEKSATTLSALEKQLDEHLKRNPNTFIDIPSLNRSLDEIVRRKRNVFGNKGVSMINNFKELLKTKGARMNIAEANQFKRDIYKELSEASFNAEVLPTNKEVLRTMASALRKSISDTSPLAARISAEQQFNIRVIDALEQQLLRKGRVNVLGLSDSVFASAGIAAGEPITGIGAGLIKRGVESTQFKTRVGQRLSQLGNVNIPSTGGATRPITGSIISKASGGLLEE